MHKRTPIDDEETVLVRIYGKNTEIFIDRKKEIENFETLNKYGFAPKLLAAFENGLAYEFSEGTPLTKRDLHCDQVWPLIARKMAEMHKAIKPHGTVEPMLWQKFDAFFQLMPLTFSDPVKQARYSRTQNAFKIFTFRNPIFRREKVLPTIAKLRKEYDDLRKSVEPIDSPLVFSHNDLLLGNILYDPKDNQITFIDYEYAAFNYQAYDIGNHFDEFAGMSFA